MKTKPSTGPERKSRKSLPSLDGRFALRAFGAVVVLALLGGVGVGTVYGYPALRAYASKRLAPESVKVHLPPFPAWLEVMADDGNDQASFVNSVKSRIVGDITLAARSRLGADPLHREDLVDCREALLRTGWFERVDQVTRIAPDAVEIDAVYVEPFTMIRDAAGAHLVTESGELLPLQYPRTARLARLPAITGTRFARPTTPGALWEGKDVKAGLQLIAFLEQPTVEHPSRQWLKQIVEVDVSEYGETESLWLTTDKGARILWGRAPGDERGIEVPARQKLAYLARLYDDFGRVDRDLRELDLVTDVVYAR